MKHIILGTAGHVDHGKTSLIKALTNIDCDTHKEEKARGITINLGFSHLNLPSGNALGIIDVPGHKDFINTMISGVGSIDIAMLVIAADSGIMPQTTEHLNIIHTLGIEKIIVALNKSDLVDEEIIELASEEIRDLFLEKGLDIPAIIPVSAANKEGLSELISEIETNIDGLKAKVLGPTFRMYIDRLFTVKGLGSVITGSVLSGKVKAGDALYLLPANKETYKVKSIQRHSSQVEEAVSGDRAAMNISGLKNEDIQKGAVLSNKILETTSLVDASLSVFDDEVELKIWSTVIFYSGTFECLAKVHLLNKDALKKGEDAMVQIHLEKPAVLLNKDKFIIRKSSADKTIGGGHVIDVQPLHHRKRTEKLITQLNQISDRINSEDQLNSQIEFELAKDKYPCLLKDILDITHKTEAEIIESIEDYSGIRLMEIAQDKVLIKEDHHQSYIKEILDELKTYHQKFYLLEEGISANFFNGKFKFSKQPLAKKYIEYLFLELQKEGLVIKRGSTWALSKHSVIIGDEIKKKLSWLEQLFLDYDLQLPIVKDIDQAYKTKKISRDESKMFLKYLSNQNRLVKYQDDYIHYAIFEKIKTLTLNELKAKPGGINLSEFRQLTACTKKIIPVLAGLLVQETDIKSRSEDNHSVLYLE